MKQNLSTVLSFTAILLAGLFACKKDNDNNKQLHLGKVFKDGLLEIEYFYTPDKKPIRRNYYNTNNGTSSFSGFRLYEYNTEKLLETMTEFSKNHGFINKYTIQYDANRKPTRMDDLKNDNTLQFYHIFDYDGQGDLTKYSVYNAATSKKTVEATLTYAQHRLTKIIRRTYINNPPTLFDSSTYSFSNKTLPSNWNYFESFVFGSLPNGDRTFIDMICDSSFYYYSDAPPATHSYVLSARQYNNEGYLIKQHFNFKYTILGVLNTSDYDRTYEYIE
jgi:hypothetical protein